VPVPRRPDRHQSQCRRLAVARWRAVIVRPNTLGPAPCSRRYWQCWAPLRGGGPRGPILSQPAQRMERLALRVRTKRLGVVGLQGWSERLAPRARKLPVGSFLGYRFNASFGQLLSRMPEGSRLLPPPRPAGRSATRFSPSPSKLLAIPAAGISGGSPAFRAAPAVTPRLANQQEIALRTGSGLRPLRPESGLPATGPSFGTSARTRSLPAPIPPPLSPTAAASPFTGQASRQAASRTSAAPPAANA